MKMLKPAKQQNIPVRVGIADDCPYRRAAIREALIESRRYAVTFCASMRGTDLPRRHNLDVMLVAVARKRSATEPVDPRVRCSCRQLRGKVLGYELHFVSHAARLKARATGLEAFFCLPDHPFQFVAHLDRLFGVNTPHGQDDRSGNPADRRPLSARERAVFELLGTGKDVKEVAAHLGVSPRTVRTWA